MKFVKKYPKLGEKKTKTFFAFLPFTFRYLDSDFRNIKETYWLQFVTVEYVFSVSAFYGKPHEWRVVDVK